MEFKDGDGETSTLTDATRTHTHNTQNFLIDGTLPIHVAPAHYVAGSRVQRWWVPVPGALRRVCSDVQRRGIHWTVSAARMTHAAVRKTGDWRQWSCWRVVVADVASKINCLCLLHPLSSPAGVHRCLCDVTGLRAALPSTATFLPATSLCASSVLPAWGLHGAVYAPLAASMGSPVAAPTFTPLSGVASPVSYELMNRNAREPKKVRDGGGETLGSAYCARGAGVTVCQRRWWVTTPRMREARTPIATLAPLGIGW